MIIVLNVYLDVYGNEEITRDLLNSIMDVEIKEVKLDCKEILDKDILSDKVGILDIRAKLNNDTWCDVEMQVVDEKNIEKRMLYYWSKMYNMQLNSGEDYEKLQKAVVVLITDFELDSLKEVHKTLSKWSLREKKHKDVVLTTDMEFYILELPKLNKYNDLNKTLRNWAKFIRNPEDLNMKDYEENENLKKAKENLNIFTEEQEEYLMAARRIMAIADKKAIEDRGYDKGMKEKQIEVAKNMLEESIDLAIISKCTGLTIEEVEKLK